MAKEAKKPASENMPAPVTFKKGETVWFCPATGDKEAVEIADDPLPGTSKYPCRFKNGGITPVNACYLAKDSK